jgi:hypothetical protein
MKIPPVGKVVPIKPRKKRPTKDDFKPYRPPDNIA